MPGYAHHMPTVARLALAQSTKGANEGIRAEMQGNKVETKVLEPLLEPLAGIPICAGTLCWTLLEPPFCAGTLRLAGTPAGTPLSAPDPLLEPTFVRFSPFLEIQHSVWHFTT